MIGRRWIVVGIVCAGVYGCYRVKFPSWTYRVRIEAELRTESGPVSGFAMMQETTTSNGGLLPDAPFHSDTFSEAGFIDLGRGRNLVILLGAGKYAEKEHPSNWVSSVFLNKRASDVSGLFLAETLSKMKRTVELSGDNRPTLVTFGDPKDLTTLKVVDPDNLAATLGPGVELVRLSMTLTDDPIPNVLPSKLPWVRDGRACVAAFELIVRQGNARPLSDPFILFKKDKPS